MRKINSWHLLFLLIMALSAPAIAQPASWPAWDHGSRSYAQALSSAERAMEHVMVYFHTD